MIEINIPSNNLKERRYIIQILFKEFLDIKYNLTVSDSQSNWDITLENQKKIIFEDSFFNFYPNELEYLKKENIPKTVNFQKGLYTGNGLAIIFGENKLNKKENTIISGLDIFASSFFMLTRWEELVNKKRDNHNRFSALESIAYKNDFLKRPIVNEYLEFLWDLLKSQGLLEKRKERKFEFINTHDVDIPLKYPNFKSGFRELLGDLLKRRNLKLFFHNAKTKINVSLGLTNDPFDTFDFLMDISEKHKVKSYFFFMGKGQTKYDNFYQSNSRFIKKLIEKIKKRNHFIGIHPTYNSFNLDNQFRNEKEELVRNLNCNLIFGRQHYLRFEVPKTWQIWDDNNMVWDSTLGYADKEGFRGGVCFEYSVFNVETRNTLRLKEKPLIVMEGSFSTYQSDTSTIQVEKKIIDVLNQVKKYNGTFVFLWHNSSFNTEYSMKYEYLYSKILSLG
ncbi:polysaccharide deacetylase family protein [Tenacibaculum finnmarkense]|uniref:polysaccharide deacetylase family protein n=1 Tax=Tenacibaculum finnmarkense TaxID=2781243 RepID=UPI001E28D255|nr:polysaccharide deacetylase family protein [Tenacibaculum finnmarkense]MCD8410900.1 polysaccharide deacetylase family protein [Tenacibaculum finnmarkense genomovar ulcerans]